MEGGERAGGGEPGLAVKVRRCKVMESGRRRESGVEVVRGKASEVGRERLERKENDSWGTAGGGRDEAVTGSHLYVSRDKFSSRSFHVRLARQRWRSVALRERACPRNTSGGRCQ